MPENKKTSQQIAKNVAKKTKKLSDKGAKTEALGKRQKELFDFIGSMPSSVQAQTIALALAQLSMSEIHDKEDAQSSCDMFRSKPFVLHLRDSIEANGIEHVLRQMADMNVDDPKDVLEVFTGETYTDEEIEATFGKETEKIF